MGNGPEPPRMRMVVMSADTFNQIAEENERLIAALQKLRDSHVNAQQTLPAWAREIIDEALLSV